MEVSYWIEVVLFFTLFMPLTALSSELQCLNVPSGASESFGYSLAATNEVVLVGDPGANIVWAFEEDAEGIWQASAIHPPSDSDADEFGRGFGRSVAIDADGAIVIGAFVEEALGVTPRKKPGDGFRRLGEVFFAPDTTSPVVLLPGLDALKDTEAFGFSVTRTGRNIAIGMRKVSGERYGSSSVLVSDVASGAQTRVSAPTSESANDFGYALASAGTTLVIGSTWLAPSGGGVIYDLDTGEKSVLTLPQETPRTGFSVATDGTRAVFGGEATVITERMANGWVVAETFAAVNGTVAIGGDRVGTLREGARNREAGANATTPPLDLTVITDGAAVISRLAEYGDRADGQWSHRALAMAADFAVVGRPIEVEKCKLAIVHLHDSTKAQRE